MSDLSIYEAIASAVIKACGTNARALRRAIIEFENGPANERTAFVLEKLRERLAELPPVERERGP